ncbi:hypothetical protein [Nocardia fluminea]|nr:hypothetical protein [Nocardia fluminea]
MLYPDETFPVLLERIRWLEELGFDQVFLPDQRPSGPDVVISVRPLQEMHHGAIQRVR